MSAVASGAARVRNGIAIPKLALGSLVGGPPQERSRSGGGQAPAGRGLAVPMLGAMPPAGPMDVDVDEASSIDSSDGSGRKRFRGPDACVASATERGPVSAPSTAPSLAIPQTARLDLSACQRAQAPSSCDETPPQSAGKAKLAAKPLNLAALGQRQAPSGGHADNPGMLNLEDMNEEDLMASYDPNNEEANYHLPHHVFKQLQLKHFRAQCSEVIPDKMFISSFQVAEDLEVLRSKGITHIVNMAGDICESKFPEHFNYVTYYLKDANHEDISLLFYRTLEWIQAAMDSGGRVLVHCREGVSRSATMVIAYLMWRFGLSFEAAHDRLRKERPVCNPNTGFTCQLLNLGKKLGVNGGQRERPAPAPDKKAVFRVAPYHPKEPFLLFVPADAVSGAGTLLDPRFGWVLQHGTSLTLWLGSQAAPSVRAIREAVEQHMRWLDTFEQCRCSLTVVEEGREPATFWQALAPQDASAPVAPRLEFDADFDVLRALPAAKEDAATM